MGGVLIDLFYDRCVAAYKSIGFKEICDYLDPCHQKGIYGDIFFDKIFISSTMKLMKPGQEIYLEAIRQSGLQADELLFIDDSPRNTEAARIAGIPSIDYVQGSDLAAIIEAALGH